MEPAALELPKNVRLGLDSFVEKTKEVCGANLTSIVLFGSAAEGRLRASSDVNLILVFKSFDIAQINELREPLRISYAAIRLGVMFLLENEIEAAADAFAMKFADIQNRHQVLFGADPFHSLQLSRASTLQRLKQVLMNLTLRLRERYALLSLREEQLVMVIAEMAGPLRASAATILELEGKKAKNSKEALELLLAQFPNQTWTEALKHMSAARENLKLEPGAATKTVLSMLEILNMMERHCEGLK